MREVASAVLMGVENDVVLRVAIKVPSDMVFVTGMEVLVYVALPTVDAKVKEGVSAALMGVEKNVALMDAIKVYNDMVFVTGMVVLVYVALPTANA